MRTKKIGIVKELYYQNEHIFIKNFIEYLGYTPIISKESAKQCIQEKRCSIVNNYLERLLYLKKRCDYIIIPYEKEQNKDILCPFLSNIKTITNQYIDNQISYNINKPITLLFNSIRITKNIPKLIISYILAINESTKQKKKLIRIQSEKVQNNKEKILIVNNPLIEVYIQDKDTILYSKYLKETIALDYYHKYKEHIPIKYIRLLIGSIYYYHNIVKIIYIIEKKDCQYQIKKYLKFLEPKIKKKIKIINI